jgi:hypothetical protein
MHRINRATQGVVLIALNAIASLVGTSMFARRAHADIRSGTGSYIGNVFVVDCTKPGASFCNC